MKYFIMLIIMFILTSCSSIESELVTVNSDGKYVGKKFNGVPIVVTNPEKLGFIVTESKYRITRDIFDSEGEKIDTKQSTEVSKTIDKTPISLGVSEIFTVDLKRPIFGTAKHEIVLDKDKYYPTKISTDVDDKTLGEIFDNIDKITGIFKPQSGQDGSGKTDGAVSKELISQIQYMLVYDPSTGEFRKAAPKHIR